jgi:hypothetical protein
MALWVEEWLPVVHRKFCSATCRDGFDLRQELFMLGRQLAEQAARANAAEAKLERAELLRDSARAQAEHFLREKERARERALEEAVVVVKRTVGGCSCCYAPCEHDDMRTQTVADLRALKGKSVQR